jgi:hypothetical protein
MRHSFNFLATFVPALRTALLAALAVALFCCAAVAHAETITLSNPGFESPDIASDGYLEGNPTGWVGTGTVGVIGEARSNVNDTPDGDQWGYTAVNGSQLGQAIGSGLGLLNTTFEVSYLATRRTTNNVNLNHNVMIMAGSETTFVGGEVLDTVNYNTDLESTTEYNSITLNLETPADYTGSNTQLWLVFENQVTPHPSAGAQFMIDQVGVEATAIPEPSVLTLLAAGLIGLIAVRRQR